MIQFVNVFESQIEHESAQIRYIESNSIELSIKMYSNSAFFKKYQTLVLRATFGGWIVIIKY